jgi:hypothetical protein
VVLVLNHFIYKFIRLKPRNNTNKSKTPTRKNEVGHCARVPHCPTCAKNAPEILKIMRDRPKINKSGLKDQRNLGSYRKQKYRENIIADSCQFL